MSFEASCVKKCASPYIREQFGENSVGGKWLMGVGLRIPLTLLGRGKGAVGGEIILLNCCKCLQISRTFFQAVNEFELPHPDFGPWTLDFRLPPQAGDRCPAAERNNPAD